MILGIGTDLCDQNRIENLLKKYPKFPQKILSFSEFENFNEIFGENAKSTPNSGENFSKNWIKKVAYLSKRWAAKEAIAKASTLGISGLGLQNITIKNHSKVGHFSQISKEKITDSSQPNFILSSEILDKIRKQFQLPKDALIQANLSISYEENFVLAFVVLSAVLTKIEVKSGKNGAF